MKMFNNKNRNSNYGNNSNQNFSYGNTSNSQRFKAAAANNGELKTKKMGIQCRKCDGYGHI